MTGVTRWNKAVTPAGADGWNLTPNIGSALDTANVVVPVATMAERDGLTPPGGKYPGMVVARTDQPGCPVETWDGTEWAGAVRHVEYGETQFDVPNNTAFGPGIPTLDNDRSRYAGVVTNTVNDLFTVSQSGVYTFQWFQVWFAPLGPGPCFFAIDRTTGGTVRLAAEQKPSAYEHTFTLSNVALNAGETVKLIFVQTSGNSIEITHRIRITKWA